MDKFVKERITFALVLLATVFALYPLTKDYSNIGFRYVGVQFKLHYFYVIFTILLSVSVYFYALQYVTPRGLPIAEKIGTTTFLLALISPWIYAILFLFYLLSVAVEYIPRIRWLAPVLTITGAVSGSVIGTLSYWFIQKAERKRENREKLARISEEVLVQLEKAKRMIDTNLNGPAIIQIYAAIISAIRRRLLGYMAWNQRIPDFQILKVAYDKGILAEDSIVKISKIRKLRNTFAHPNETTTDINCDKALKYLEFASNFISNFEREIPINELVEILSKEGAHSFKWLRDHTMLKFTDEEFSQLINEYPNLFKAVTIPETDSGGKRFGPKNRGIKLTKSAEENISNDIKPK